MKNIKKISVLLGTSTVMVLVSSCAPKFREDLQAYVDNFSVSYCTSHFKEGSLTYELTYVNGEEISKRTCTYSYSYLTDGEYESALELTNTNELITSDNPAYRYETIRSNHDEAKTYSYYVHRGDLEATTTISQDEVYNDHIRNFFYTQVLTDTIHTKGMYYGDDIKSTTQGQECYTIDEDNHLVFNKENFKIYDEIMSSYYKVNEYGLLLESRSTGKNEDNSKSYTANLVINYTNVIVD